MNQSQKIDLFWSVRNVKTVLFFLVLVSLCVCVCGCMGAAGLISLSSGLPLTSSSSILQFLCVCVCVSVCTCMRFCSAVFSSLLPRLWIIHHLKACGCLYHLPTWKLIHVCVCVCVCVNVHAGACARCDLTLSLWSLRLFTTNSLLSLLQSPSFFPPCFPSRSLPSCDVVSCVCVCVRPVLDCVFNLVCLSLRGALIGWVWMEGLGYPSGFATCPAGTTQAPTSSTQVRTQQALPMLLFQLKKM